MVKDHFLTRFDICINKFLYLQYSDLVLGIWVFQFLCPLGSIHWNATTWCSVSTCIKFLLMNDYFNAKIKEGFTRK